MFKNLNDEKDLNLNLSIDFVLVKMFNIELES